MQTQLHPYLSFRDNTRQAMEFYQSVFGGELTINTYKEFNASEDPTEDDKVMHAMLVANSGITFMAADTPKSIELKIGDNFSLTLNGDNEEELRGYWQKLLEGGRQTMPLDKAPWGDTFGMLIDQFGIHWMVDITPRQAQV